MTSEQFFSPFPMKPRATESNVVTIIPAQEQRLSLRIDEQLHGEAREYLRAGLQGSANSHRAFTTDIRQYADWCE